MKTALWILALLAVMPVASARACSSDSHVDDSFGVDLDAPMHWAERQPSDARYQMNTRGGEITLLLNDRVLAIQLSDRVLHKIDRKMRAARDDDRDLLGRTIRIAVLSGVSTLLEHSVEVPLADVKSVDYRDGRLRVTSYDGRELFRNTHVDHRDVLEDFAPADARQFVEEFKRARARASAG